MSINWAEKSNQEKIPNMMMVKMILTEAENGMFATRTGSECLISSARIPKDENIKKKYFVYTL